MLGCAFVDVLLRRVHIVDLIEAVRVPDGQVRVHLDVFCTFLVIDFSAEVLHYAD